MQKKRVSKGEWLDRALEVLAEKGVEGVRVTRLAHDLNISKSGFYWHFRDRKDLLNQLIIYWAYEYTDVVTQNPELKQADPESCLNMVASMIREHNLARYDLSMRAWATKDTIVAEMVEQVYQERLKFTRELFKELGFKGEELEMRTRLFVCYHSWESTMFEGVSERKLARLQKLRIRLLTKK